MFNVSMDKDIIYIISIYISVEAHINCKLCGYYQITEEINMSAYILLAHVTIIINTIYMFMFISLVTLTSRKWIFNMSKYYKYPKQDP